MTIKNEGEQVAQSINDIAIIGLSCRFPGGVNSPREFWDFLMAGGDGIVPVPADRWDNKAYYDADREKKNKMYVNKGGFIEKMDQFDPLFFGMSPAEASRVDPQHRWLLELTYEALENAGLQAKDLKGSDTAVYIGQFMHDYEQLQLDSMAHGLINSHSATGPSTTLTANRISYLFDFRGPSVTVDTACSSALVALDLACKAVLSGDSQMGLAGGVNILLRPELTMSICKASMLSPEGHCKSFDAAANGYVRSEGAGIVLVKKLSEAQRDGNDILAVIKATGVNQDGQTPGITVPSGEAQKRLLLKSLKQAGVSSETIQYAEAHGTGTAVGDPIEVNALGSVLGAGNRAAPCIIGSVKSNIGHMEAAAGVAGLIKTVLAMSHGIIPQNIHYHKTNPAINLEELNLRVADNPLPWPETQGGLRRALVNSFGFGGTNANVILEESPKSSSSGASQTRTTDNRTKLLPISSKSETGLKDLAAKYLAHLSAAKKPIGDDDGDFNDICYSAATKREHHRYRLMVNGFDEKDAREGLEAFVQGQPSPFYISGKSAEESRKTIGFVFSGMGTQWRGMGRELYKTEPVFKAEFDRCSRALEPYTGWSLVDAVYNEAEGKNVDDTFIAQPGIFALQVSLVALLKSWNILPSCVVGHSAGEVGAAYVAGALSFDDAIKVIYHRSRLQQTTEGMGKMLAVGLSRAALASYLVGLEEEVSIAAINSEETVTLSGNEVALTALAKQLDEKGFFTRFLSVGVPYHSPVMDRLRGPLIEALNDIVVHVPRLPLYSTVSGQITQPGDWTAYYWADNVRDPVLFKDAVEVMAADGVQIFLEVAPHAALASSITKTLLQQKVDALVVPTLKRGQNDAIMMAQTLGALHVAGQELDWRRLYPRGGRFTSLPNYAWQHARYWSEAEEVQRSRLKNVSNRNGFSEAVHPLVGSKLNSLELIWQKALDLEELPYLADHRVEGEVVYPAAGYIEMALGLAQREYKKQSVTLEDIEFKRALFIHADKPTLVETAVNSDGSTLTIRAADAHTGEWSVYSALAISRIEPRSPNRRIVLAELMASHRSTLNKAEFYQHCDRLGLSYQTQFRAVENAWSNKDETIVELVLPDSLLASNHDYLLHPALLDGAFQGVFPTLDRGFLPVSISSFHYYKKPSYRSYCLVTITSRTPAEITGDLILFELDGTITVEIAGIHLRSTNTQHVVSNLAQTVLYDYGWKPEAYREFDAATPLPKGAWIIFADAKGIARRLAKEMERRDQTVFIIEKAQLKNQASEWMSSADVQSSDDIAPFLKPFAAQCSGILYLWSLDNARDEELSTAAMFDNCRNTTVVPLYLAQAIDRVDWRSPPHIYFITQSVYSLGQESSLPQPSQGALWGFGRVFSTEYSGYKFSLIDLADQVSDELIANFADQLFSGDDEQEIALRPEARYINRLRALSESLLHEYAERKEVKRGSRPFRIGHKFRTSAAEKLSATVFQLPQLKTAEVAVRVEGAAVTLRGLEAILKPNNAPDADRSEPRPRAEGCVGVVTAVGREVKGLHWGDSVIAFAQHGLASVVHADPQLVIKKPSHLSVEEALALPAAFLPAHYSLNYLAQLKEGEHVLIHEAADAVGLAAIQFARLKQATIYASARTPEKRARLRDLGIEHIYDSTTYDFVDQIMAASLGKGIDVVLNALGGAFVNKTLRLLKPCGRFVEFGNKPSAAHAALVEQLFDKGISYHSVDLSKWVLQRTDLCSGMLAEVASLFEARLLTPIPLKLFSISKVGEAVSQFKEGDYFEVVGLSFDETDLLVGQGIDRHWVNQESTYLVTGGLGGLGLEMMNGLVEAGARSIVLIGRSAPSEHARHMIDNARNRGAVITPLQADVSNPDDTARVLRLIEKELMPLAGIIHAAGALDDGVIMQQTEEKFEKVLTSKIKGAWNLHRLTEHISLDFFVCFSSIASVIGWAGQSNYAAANAFIDTLAHHRRALGKPALTINWGPWSGSGMAANLDTRDIQRMNDAGMTALAPKVALEAMSQLLMFHVPQAGVFELDWSRLVNPASGASRKSLLSDLIDAKAGDEATNFTDQLKAASPALHAELLAEKISSVLAEVLGIESGSSIDRNKSVADYGVNSLMAMDLRNRLQGLLKTTLPATLVLKYPTVSAMVKCIVERGEAADPALDGEKLYWRPENPEKVEDHEINGPLATLTPSVRNWIHEGHTTHFNVGALLEIDASKFDLQALKIALRIVFTYHDGCRLQIFPENGELRQEIVSLGKGVQIAEYDLTGLGRLGGKAKMAELNDKFHQSFSFTRGSPLYRAVYYKIDDENPHRFLLIFHHYVSDAMSQKLMWQSVVKTYLKVLKKEAVYLPAKKASLIDWTGRLHKFAYGEAVDQLPYWLEKIARSRACNIADEFKSSRERTVDDYVIYSTFLESEDYSKLTEYCRARNYEISDVGTYALVKAFARLTGANSLWVDLITHARSGIFDEIEISHLFGQISESASLLFEVVPDGTASEQIRAMRKQRIEVPNGGIGLRALRFINQSKEVRAKLANDKSPQIGLNFDVTDYEAEAGENWVRFAKEDSGKNQGIHLRKTADKLRLAFFIDIKARRGRLMVTIAYYKDRFDAETIAGIANDFFAILKSIPTEDALVRSERDPGLDVASPLSERQLAEIAGD